MTAPKHDTPQFLRIALAHEFQILAGLRHPHIVSVLDYGFDRTRQPYFTMEFLPQAQTILEVSKNQQPEQQLLLIEQLLQSLAYLHRHGILHRDLKPHNVLVCNDTVRVLDFGLASSEHRALDSYGGTLYYLAPEIWLDQPHSQASDLYAVGVMTYELLVGTHPFAPKDHTFVNRVLDVEPDLSAFNTMPAIADIVSKLLSKEPSHRYATAESAIKALGQATNQPVVQESEAIRESYLQAAKFVGRQDELKQLVTALKNAVSGRGSGWLLGGESGVGKSRLLNEIRIQALVNGMLVFHGQGVPDGGGLPYQLWRRPLQHLVMATPEIDDAAAGVLRPLVPNIEKLLMRPVVNSPQLSGKAAQQRLFMAIAHLFHKQTQPILLILEDLQWTEESLLPISYLTQQIEDVKLMVVGSFRDDERPDLPKQLPDLQLINLARLSVSDLTELSQAMLGDVGTRPEIISLLMRESEGNTFFVVEVVRALANEAGQLAGIGQMNLPSRLFPRGIQNIIERRLSQVPDIAQQLLKPVAAAGRFLDLKIVDCIRGLQSMTLDLSSWLQMCADAAVLEIVEGQWCFAHDKLRDGLLLGLASSQYVSIYEQAAHATELSYPDSPEVAAKLTYLWHEAQNHEKEKQYAAIAGRLAAEQFNLQRAATLLSRALELTGDTDLTDRYQLLLARAKVWDKLGSREPELADLNELTTVSAGLGNPQLQAEAAINRSRFYEQVADFSLAYESAQEAINLLQPLINNQDDVNPILGKLMADARLAWGGVLATQGYYDEALPHYQEALNWLRPMGDSAHLALALRQLGILYWRQRQLTEASQTYQEALEIARQIRDISQEGANLNNLGIVARDLGEYDHALAFYGQALQIYTQMGSRYAEGIILQNLGVVAENVGQYELAWEHLQKALPIKLDTGDRYGEMLLHRVSSHVAKATEDYESAHDHLQITLDIEQELGHRSLGIELHNELGFLFLAQDRYEEAGQTFALVRQLREKLGDSHFQVELMTGLAAVALGKNKLAEALDKVNSILAYIDANPQYLHLNHPLQVFPTCIRVLHEAQDPRTKEVSHRAYIILMERAERITDTEMRRAFVGAVPDHRDIVILYKQLHRIR